MILITDLAQAVAVQIQKKTGVRTVCGHTLAKGKPLYVVEIMESLRVLIDGGRQVERTLALTINCIGGDQEEQFKMAEELIEVLFPHITACGRCFSTYNYSTCQVDGRLVVETQLNFCDIRKAGEVTNLPADRFELEFKGE